MDGWLLSARSLPQGLPVPVPLVLVEPLLGGLLFAVLAHSLRAKRKSAISEGGREEGAPRRGRHATSSGDSSPAPSVVSTSSGFDVEVEHCGLPREPHLQGTLLPSTGLLHSNPASSYTFENANCWGKFLPLHRPSCTPELDASGNYLYGDHFAGRRRVWELRIQMQFKKPVAGSLLAGIELDNYVPLNAASKKLMGLTVAALRRVAGDDLYHSVGDDPRQGQGSHEKPVFMMPLWAADQLVITPEGEAPPELTDPHFSAFGTRRADDRQTFVREILALDLKPGPTYTFCFWGISQFLDCIKWQLQRIIPFKTIDFNQFCGRPPVTLVLYSLEPGADGETRHLQSRKNYYFRYALWSSRRPPTVQKIRELVPSEGEAGANRIHVSAAASDRSFLERLTGCCMGPRSA